MLYADDNADLICYRPAWGKAWSDALIGSAYLPSRASLSCLASQTKLSDDRWRTYAMYRSVSELSSSPPTAPFLVIASGDESNGDHFYRTAKMEYPSAFVILADSTQSTDTQKRNFYYFTWQGFGSEHCGIHTLHGTGFGVANCLMVDGHVESAGTRKLAQYCRSNATSNKYIKPFVSKQGAELFTFNF